MQRRVFCRGVLGGAFWLAAHRGFAETAEVVAKPREYTGALRNPLKGLRAGSLGQVEHLPYASLVKHYIRWNDIEQHASDGVERIRDYCNEQWAAMPAMNTKIIPRVYLDWPPNGHYWPQDLPQGDYASVEFRRRAVRLIEKLAVAWDNDPRVAFVETGLIGLWGEQHDPTPTPELVKSVGDAYTANFHHKPMMNRYPGLFTDYKFGIYWDSFGHKEEAPDHIAKLESPRLRDRWLTAPMGGETAFDWGTPLGKDPTDALVKNTDTIVALIRRLHWNHLGWLSEYDQKNAAAVAGAARVQEALGYRFVLEEARYPGSITPGTGFRAEFSLRNAGASLFYGAWPVELALLDAHSKAVRWHAPFKDVNLQSILPNQDAATKIASEFVIPAELPHGDYLLALAIVDPSGNEPAVRLATENYFRGGWHPVGWIGVGKTAKQRSLPKFDDPASETLSYKA